MTGRELDDTADDDAGICGCGVVDDLNEAGDCSVCSGSPHGRECPCDECNAYWLPLCAPSPDVAGR